MGKGYKGNHSKLSWQDVYFNGEIDERYEVFCEDSQTIHKIKRNDGWDTYEDCMENYKDDFQNEFKLMSGKVKRIGD